MSTMRFLLITSVLLVTVVVTSANYNPLSFNPTHLTKLNPKRNTVSHFMQKRQSQACISAYEESQTPQFQQCSQLFSDGSDITVDQLSGFCDDDGCVSVLIKVFTDLQNCGALDANTTVSISI